MRYLLALVMVAIAAAPAAAGPGIGIAKDNTLHGTGASTDPLGVNGTYVQLRVSSSCTAGSAIRAIAADGTVTCESAGATYVPGLGITITGLTIAIDDIYVDSRAAASAVTNYLIGRRHKRIAMVAGRGGPQGTRVEGYRAALTAAGGEPYVVIVDEFSEAGGLRAAETVLASGYNPTAIFAANDLMAIGVIQALRERRIEVPGQIAVVGFDDISAAKLVTPPLTTVAQFQGQMGAKAAQILLERLRGATSEIGTALEMPFGLIERGST